ncbi:MAG: hypothetical protein MRY59_12685 [Aquisalinus sp.]|nr:hypothetical protein [Aquisalinus sp.]
MRTLLSTAATALLLILPANLVAAELPIAVDEALTRAEAYADIQPSFSMRASSPGEDAIVYRYDAQSDSWSVIDGDASTLDEETSAGIAEMQAELSQPGELTYASARDSLSVADLIETATDREIYRINISGKNGEMPKAMREALDMTLHLDTREGHISLISMQAREPFKPAMVAKVETLIVEQRFANFPDMPVPLLESYYNKASGEAMFQKFDEEFTIEFFDYQLPAE